MKKIAIFTHNLGQGGIEKYTCSLANILSQKYDVEIISSTVVGDEPSFYVDPKVKITYLINDRFDAVSIKVLLKKIDFISIMRELKRRKEIKRLYVQKNVEAIQNLKCDFVITTRLSLTKLVNESIANKNIVLIATDHNYHNYDKKYYGKLIDSLANFDYLVLATDELCDFYKNKIGTTKCIKIPNTIDFMPTEKSNLNQKNIISVGRFANEKGFLDLIDVFNMVHQKDNEVKLFLLGDGYQKKELLKKINEYNLNDYVIMPGFIKRENQNNYYLNSSIYVMSSYTEAFGLVLIESMSYGVPCVAFDSASGAKELLSNGNGVLIDNRNKEKMAKEIIKLLNNKKELLMYQNRSLKLVKNYTLEKFEEKWLNLLSNKKR